MITNVSEFVDKCLHLQSSCMGHVPVTLPTTTDMTDANGTSTTDKTPDEKIIEQNTLIIIIVVAVAITSVIVSLLVLYLLTIKKMINRCRKREDVENPEQPEEPSNPGYPHKKDTILSALGEKLEAFDT